jgi:hypothetical protein
LCSVKIGLALWLSSTLGSLLDTAQLVMPESLERFRPLVQRPESVRIRPVEHSSAITSDAHKSHLSEHLQMLGNRRLPKPEAYYDFPHGSLLDCQVAEDFPPARLGNRIESVRSCCGTRHAPLYILI